MRYFGGKSQTCKEISSILNGVREEGQVFLSPFTGGGWVEQYIEGPKVLNDKHNYLVELYRGLQNGWEAPTELSREEYMELKENPEQDRVKSGFVGFGCSFGGKWFGGYANDKSGRNYCLNAKNSLERKLENGLLRDAKVKNKSYDEFEPEGMLIYADPPYKATTQYSKKVVGPFDSDEFWETMRRWSKTNEVYISEYQAPEDFEVVWAKGVRLDMQTAKDDERVEKLFKYRGEVGGETEEEIEEEGKKGRK